MDKLLEALAEKGVNGSAFDEDQLRKVAKAVGLDPANYLPRDVKIVKHTRKGSKVANRYVATGGYVVPGKDGTSQNAKGLFLRVEAIDDAIEDLMRARGMLTEEPE